MAPLVQNIAATASSLSTMQIMASVLPEVDGQNHGNKSSDLVVNELAEELQCRYAVQDNGHGRYLLWSEIPAGLGINDLHEAARKNLLREVNDKTFIHPMEYGGVAMTCGGEYEAALLTLPEYWKILELRFGDEIAFAIPTRETILFTAASDQAGINGMTATIENLQSSGETVLSEHIYCYRKGEISTLQ